MFWKVIEIPMFQQILRSIWGGLIYLPMPWQIIVVTFLLLLLLPLLFLRILPWLLAITLKIVFVLSYGTVFVLFWFFNKIEDPLQNFGNTPLQLLQAIERFFQGALSLLEKAKEICQKIETKAFQYKWIANNKKLYLFPLIILPIWFFRPWLGFSSELTFLIDKSIEAWCSLEHWSMTSQWQPSNLTCTYPNQVSRRSNSFKPIEYQSKFNISDITKQMQKKPIDLHLLMNRANAFLSIEEYDSAFRDFNRILDFNPASAPACVGKGKIYLMKKDFNKALAEFDKAIQKDPKYAPAYEGRGDVYSRRNWKKSASAEYRKARQLNASKKS